MRRAGYAIGILMLLLAAAAAVAQLLYLLLGETYAPVSIGSMWSAVHAGGLVGFRALIEESSGGFAWAPVQFVLTLPAWISLAVPGLLLFFACRRRERGFGRY